MDNLIFIGDNFKLNIVLIGMGPYAKRHYLNYFKKHRYLPEIIIDLESKRDEINEFLAASNLNIPVYFVSDSYRDCENLPQLEKENLLQLFKQYRITHAIIATEPKAHFSYLTFLIDNGIHTFVEKPLTAPVNASFSLPAAEKIEGDYLHILQKIKENPNPNLRIDLHCHRRYHPIYQFVQKQIEAFVSEFNIPPTFCEIYHCDGMWNMPDEFLTRENHPYKYGYGKLLHSGYHFIDLLSIMLKSSYKYCVKKPDYGELFGKGFSPDDFLGVLDSSNYEKLFRKKERDALFDAFSQNLSRLGELDFFSTLQLYQGTKKMTTCILNLLQTGFSRRAWENLPQDTYKSNGRIRHERLNMQFGPLFNIQVHSYLSAEALDASVEDPYSIGQSRHFDICIFRNSELIGGKPFELIQSNDFLPTLKQSFNEMSREESLSNFLQNRHSLSWLSDHEFSIQLLSRSLKTLCRENADLTPIEKFKIDAFIKTPHESTFKHTKNKFEDFITNKIAN